MARPGKARPGLTDRGPNGPGNVGGAASGRKGRFRSGKEKKMMMATLGEKSLRHDLVEKSRWKLVFGGAASGDTVLLVAAGSDRTVGVLRVAAARMSGRVGAVLAGKASSARFRFRSALKTLPDLVS